MFHVKHIKGLKENAKVLGIDIDKGRLEKFDLYISTLLKWNKKINLISRGDEDKIVEKHILDSLTSVSVIGNRAKVLDIGSGAGFPGVPIKIVRKDIEMDLLEPKRRRYHFLKYIISILGLKGIEVYNVRAEEFRFSGRGYDIVFARGVGRMSYLTEIVVPFLCSTGRLITYRSSVPGDLKGWKVIETRDRVFSRGKVIVLKYNLNG